ncbi:RTA1-domain-containing protein [Coprinopsis marcescibilis]|uniref:RTA1-domain-containing protein n=1 Tax=Coprinopsis marcescibilis TaxID=230819 RepID=A0A5C3L2T0_COPMA|nr:RTA1-domain-containing protein [Coprinopsis marcescibilis]
MSSPGPEPPTFDISVQATPDNIYGYIPSKTSALAFIVLFGLATLLHTGAAIKKKMWFLFPTVILCGVLETVGWSGRLWSHYEPYSIPAFQLQIVTLITAPTPLLAANFVIFGRIIRALGTNYSRLRPRMYTIIFVTCDVISLAIQGGGGGIAATAEGLEAANRGGNIMLGGIAFQLFVIVVYSILAVEYIVRYNNDWAVSKSVGPDDKTYTPRGQMTKNTKLMLFALLFNTLCLFVRAIYRAVELAEGWAGEIIQTELYFDILDGTMIVLAIYAFIFGHPGCLLQQEEVSEKEKQSSSRASTA